MQIGTRVALRLALFVASLLVVAAPSQAIPFSLEVSVGGVSAGTLNEGQLGCSDTGTNTATCSAQNIDIGGLRITNLDLSLDNDPVATYQEERGMVLRVGRVLLNDQTENVIVTD